MGDEASRQPDSDAKSAQLPSKGSAPGTATAHVADLAGAADASLRTLRVFIATSFISRLGDHLAEFGMVLIMLKLFPGLLWPALTFSTVRSLSTLILGKWLGSLLDRYPVRRVLGGAIVLQTLSLLAFAISAQQQVLSPWYFLPSSVGLAIGGFLYEVGLTYTLVPALATGARLTRLTTLFHSMHQFAEVGGPLIAGVLFAWGGAVPVLAMDGLTFVAELIGLLTLKLAPGALVPSGRLTSGPETDAGSSEGTSLDLSWGRIWHTLKGFHPALPFVVLSVGWAWCNGMSPYNSGFLFFMSERLHLSEGQLSWLRSGGALFSITGALLFPRIASSRARVGTLLLFGVFLEETCLIVAALFRNTAPVVLGAVLLSRLGLNLFILSSIRLRQELIPLEVRGAVNGRINAFFRGMSLLMVGAQLTLEHTDRSYAWLAWTTATVMAFSALTCIPAYRRLRSEAVGMPALPQRA